jgi:hypothetical protein
MQSLVPPYSTSLVRIRDAGGRRVVGAGFLIDDDLVCTCAHVVAEALDLRADDTADGKEVALDFPYLSEPQVRARVVAIDPLRDDESGDIALLRLLGHLPAGTLPTPILIDWGGPDQRCRVMGFPADEGEWATLVLRDRLPNGLVQIDPEAGRELSIRGGFSGAPVWNQQVEATVGMIVAVREKQHALMIPIEQIQNMCRRNQIGLSDRPGSRARRHPITPRQFLAHYGLRFNGEDDDFFAKKAEHMQFRLPAAFVEGPLENERGGAGRFDDLLGPWNMLLFGEAGCGKTSYCYEIARRADSERYPPPLIVQFNVNEWLMPARLDETYLLKHYLSKLISKTLEELRRSLAPNQTREEHLRNNAAWNDYQELSGQYGVGYDLLPRRRWPERGFGESLRMLANVAKAADFDGIYILIDGFEAHANSERRQKAATSMLEQMISPIVAVQWGFTFKFFLPKALERSLHARIPYDLQAIRVYRLGSWSEAQLLALLRERFQSFSRIPELNAPGGVMALQQLCEKNVANVDQIIVKAAYGSPRRLIRIVENIIEDHCASISSAETPISFSTIEAVLRDADTRAGTPDGNQRRRLSTGTRVP